MGDTFDTLTGEIAISPRPAMPPEIAAAIVNVMSKIRRLAKDGQNNFQRYQYTSVDQFFEAVGPLMAEAEIFTVVYEGEMDVAKREIVDDRGNIKSSVWLSAKYDIYLFHANGKSYGPIARSIQVPASGAQSFASAMSYTEKYFLRSLFKIPTGDVDLDADDTHALPHGKSAPRPPTPMPAYTPPKEQFITDAQTQEIGDLLKSCGKGTWEPFALALGVDRISTIPSHKFDGAISWLNGRIASNKAKVVPPNPNAPSSDAPKPATDPFNFDAFQKALKKATNDNELNAIYETLVTNRPEKLHPDEISECDALLNEAYDRLSVDGKA